MALMLVVLIITADRLKESGDIYLEAYKNYLTNFGPDFLQEMQRAKRKYTWVSFVMLFYGIVFLVLLISICYQFYLLFHVKNI